MTTRQHKHNIKMTKYTYKLLKLEHIEKLKQIQTVIKN